MEVRGQELDFKVSGSSSYGHQSPGAETRRDGSNQNGSAALTCTQTLDHLHYQQRQPLVLQSKSPNPDRVGVSVGSNSKPSTVRYRECLKNHAASIGGNVYDGCGEFMPSGEEGSIEALKCAACDCHRNFHRKEVDGETQFGGNSARRGAVLLNPLQLPPALPSPTMLHHQKYSFGLHASPSSAMVAPMSVAFGGLSGGTESSSEDLNPFHSEGAQAAPPPFVLSKKRFRTKFTQEQKEKMLEFAEKVGWRINKQDEEEVERFCTEAGVKRQVFKVWMHNNKNNLVKKQQAD